MAQPPLMNTNELVHILLIIGETGVRAYPIANAEKPPTIKIFNFLVSENSFCYNLPHKAPQMV